MRSVAKRHNSCYVGVPNFDKITYFVAQSTFSEFQSSQCCADQIETSISPRAIFEHLTTTFSRGVGILTENWTGGVRFQMIFFFAPKSLTAINRCLDEMEEFNGRDTAISCRGHFPFRTVREIVATLFAFVRLQSENNTVCFPTPFHC